MYCSPTFVLLLFMFRLGCSFCLVIFFFFFFSSRRRHTRCALVTGVQTCALPIFFASSFLLGRAVAPFDQLVGSWRSFVAARASHGEIMAWLDGATDDAPQTSLPRPKGRVDVERMTVEEIGRA